MNSERENKDEENGLVDDVESEPVAPQEEADDLEPSVERDELVSPAEQEEGEPTPSAEQEGEPVPSVEQEEGEPTLSAEQEGEPVPSVEQEEGEPTLSTEQEGEPTPPAERDGEGADLTPIPEDSKPPKRNRKMKWIVGATLLGVIATIVLAAFLSANHMLNRINYEKESEIYREPSDIVAGASTTPAPTEEAEEEFVDDRKKNLFNILLIGEEQDETERRGRSDTCILLSVNKKKKAIRMISFLRDSYVRIPGYLDNKLNTAYQKGGGPLACETIETNFGVKVDGYIRVMFEDFEKIIDTLGGVEITLSKAEAKYLNSTNYISHKKYRNVKEGRQKLNGNQALGYCRIRKRPTIDGIYDDWGRTARQRTVLTQIYESYRDQSPMELISIMDDVLPLATTNMKKGDLIYLVRLVSALEIADVETMAVPVYGGYEDGDVPERGIGGVLSLDFAVNNQKIDDFLHEKGEYANAEKEEGEGMDE